MWGHIERFGACERKCGGCIRIFEEDWTWGDPYRYSFPFHEVEPGVIELFGIIGKEKGGRVPTPSEGRAMLKACAKAGLRVVRERKAGARLGVREITRKFETEGGLDKG